MSERMEDLGQQSYLENDVLIGHLGYFHEGEKNTSFLKNHLGNDKLTMI